MMHAPGAASHPVSCPTVTNGVKEAFPPSQWLWCPLPDILLLPFASKVHTIPSSPSLPSSSSIFWSHSLPQTLSTPLGYQSDSLQCTLPPFPNFLSPSLSLLAAPLGQPPPISPLPPHPASFLHSTGTLAWQEGGREGLKEGGISAPGRHHCSTLRVFPASCPWLGVRTVGAWQHLVCMNAACKRDVSRRVLLPLQ